MAPLLVKTLCTDGTHVADRGWPMAPPEEITRAFVGFVLWATAKGLMLADWNARLQGWFTEDRRRWNQHDRHGGTTGRSSSRRQPTREEIAKWGTDDDT